VHHKRPVGEALVEERKRRAEAQRLAEEREAKEQRMLEQAEHIREVLVDCMYMSIYLDTYMCVCVCVCVCMLVERKEPQQTQRIVCPVWMRQSEPPPKGMGLK